MPTSRPGIRPLSPSSGGSPGARPWPLMSFPPAAQWPRSCWPGDGFARSIGQRTALFLGLALSLNWTWGRVGGSIQSEPLYMLCELLAVLAAVQAGRRGSVRAGIGLGLALAGCVLVRQVGVCLVAAVLIDLGPAPAVESDWVGGADGGGALPPLGRLAGGRPPQHAGRASSCTAVWRPGSPARRCFTSSGFRIKLTGPVVEVGTVFHRSAALAVLVNLWAAVATGVMIWGWARSLRSPRRRLAGLIAFMTSPLLLVWPFTEAGRFLIPLVPFMLVGATEGLAQLMARAGIKCPRDWAVRMILLISIPYAAYAVRDRSRRGPAAYSRRF